MDKERFSNLLQDPSQVTNADIKALNEYRKKYPYFQSLYVVVAKALKDREHPKTEAFIKKAAIYSANRAHLKEIIEGDFNFKEIAPEAKQEIPQKPVIPVESRTKQEDSEKADVQESQESAKEKELEAAKEVRAEVKETKELEQKVEEKKTTEKKPVEEPKAQTEEKTQSIRSESQKPEQKADQDQQIEDDLAEIEAAKRRIEALLSGKPIEEVAEEKKSKKPLSEKKKNQIEIIEKFIQNEPQMDRDKLAEAESKTDIEDLANKSLLKERDYETETLAKLMVKQGKLQKAENIYKKLSLKFPEKSAYFATQIEKLKSK